MDNEHEKGVESGPRWLSSGALPPGYTVDELRWHRKKRPPVGLAPVDNLAPGVGSMKGMRSEYTRRFRPFRYGPQSVSSDDEAVSAPEDVGSDAEDDTLPALARRRRPRGRRAAQMGSALGSVDSLVPLSTEHRDKFVPLPPYELSLAFRRGSKREGVGATGAFSDGSVSDIRSEMCAKYIKPERTDRPPIVRRPTSLTQLTKMESETSAARSETADKFVGDLLTAAASAAHSGPYKRRTQLRLEGPLMISSETRSSYVPQDGGARPPLAKRATTLRLEGDLILSPEYRHSFLPPSPIKPAVKETPKEPPKEAPPPPKPEPPPKPAEKPEESEVKHKELPIDRDPEYRSSFVDFTRERTQATTSRPPSRHRKLSTMRGGEEISTRRRRSETKKEEEDDGRFECKPEYRKAYINYLTRENRERIPRPFPTLPDQPKETIRVVSKPPSRGGDKSRDRSVPRTPRQEKVLVPDLSGNSVRRMSSIFGPRPHEVEHRISSPCPIHSGHPRRHSPCGRLARGCITDSSSDEPSRRVTYGSSPIGPSFVVLDGGREINNNEMKTTKLYRRPPPWYEPPSI